MSKTDFQLLNDLLLSNRWATLATLNANGAPQTSHVAYLIEPGFQSVLMHLSNLAPHTANFTADDRVSLAISQPDEGALDTDPQALVRVALEGRVSQISKTTAEYSNCKDNYLRALPQAAPLFEFTDFALYRLDIQSGRLVGGFGRARRVSCETLKRASAL